MQQQFIKEKQDLTFLQWAKARKSSGTAGSFLKAYSELGDKKTYYKLSNFDIVTGMFGFENLNELIADRLLTLLAIEHLHYTILNADIVINDQQYTTWVCASEDFKKAGESKIALDTYYVIEKKPNETPLEFCIRNSWESYVYEMFLVDFLILNRDRHGANIEVLRNREEKTIRLAPLFDHGLSLLCSCRDEKAIETFFVMEDKPTNTFLGTRSVFKNLELIPAGEEPKVNTLQESDKEQILEGLWDFFPESLLEKSWQMIWQRWCYYENFCNTR